MKSTSPTALLPLALAALALAAVPLRAAPAEPAGRARWHLEAGPALWLNAKLAFGATADADPALAAPANRTYDDGFNRIDSSGNLGDGSGGILPSRTGNFGFLSDSQVNVTAGTLAMHVTRPVGEYLGKTRPARRPGFDWAVRLSLAEPDDQRDWGLEVGVDFNRLNHDLVQPVREIFSAAI